MVHVVFNGLGGLGGLGRFALLAGFIFMLAALLLAWEISRFAEVDQTRPADAAIVLGAAVWRGQPSPVLRERINHAVALYESGQIDKIIFTGGVGLRDELSEAEVSRRYAMARGVAAADILIEERSTSTIENLAFARSVAADVGLDSFLIVSTPYHMKRALWIADDLGLEAYSSPTRTIRWIRPGTQRRALVQETISLIVHTGRRFTPEYRSVINSGAVQVSSLTQ